MSVKRWKKLPERVRQRLEAAGEGPGTDFSTLTVGQIRALPGIGKVSADAIRAVYPLKRSNLPAKQAPSHGHGKLYRGGVPGNKGGGRRPSEIRGLFREDALLAREHIIAVLDQKRVCPECRRPPIGTKELIQAFSAFSKFGLGEAGGIDRDQLADLLVDLAEDVQAIVVDEEQLQEIHRRWRARIRNRVTL